MSVQASNRKAINWMSLARQVPGAIVRRLPDRAFARIMFFRKKKAMLRLGNPQTYSEKIQWLKIYGGLERYAKFVDKYEVRDYISRTIGSEYLIPLIGVWDKFDDIPFDTLPASFVLKATHGQGYNFICRDKAQVDLDQLRTKVNKWLGENFYTVDREPQYKNCTPRIIVEQYMQDESGELRDYKFACFSGAPHWIQVIGDRSTGTTEDMYDSQWTHLAVTEVGYPNSPRSIPKPAQLQDMWDLATKLSSKFAFVRVDLYLVDGKIYFGELTFTPANGIITYAPKETDLALGALIDLTAYSK
jgi:hypothetical protein